MKNTKVNMKQSSTLKPQTVVNMKFLFVSFIINIFPLFINFVWILLLREYRSEFLKKDITVQLHNSMICAIFLFNMVLYIFLMIIFFFIQKKRFIVSERINIFFVRKKIELFLCFIIIGKLLFFLKTGVGKAASEWSVNRFSFIFNMFNLDTLFLVYYLSFRTVANRRFVLIVILYTIFKILSGWTGFILTIVLMEIYCHINSKKVKKYLLLLPSVFLVGALAYQFIYPLKMFIRLGVMNSITYSEALIKLIERLSWFSHSCVGVQNSDKILELYRSYGYIHTEIKAFFRPFVPSFIFPDKKFRSVGNLIMNSVYPKLGDTTSSNFGQLVYLYNLFRISISDFVLYFIILFINTFLYKFFMDMVSPNKSQGISFSSNYILFSYFLSMFSVGALENISYGWISIIWTYLFLFCIGAIRIARK